MKTTIAVINYHYIRDLFVTKYPGIHGVTPAQFRDQLLLLGKEGTFIHPLQIKEAIEHGVALPERSLLVTFDDGFQEQYHRALPILDELGIPAIFFVITRHIEEKTLATVHKIHLLRTIMPSAELLQAVIDAAKQLGCHATELTEEERQKAIFHNRFETEEVALMKYYLNFKFTGKEQQEIISRIFARQYDEERVHDELYFTREQLSELGKRGYVGSHCYDHIPAGLQSKAEVYRDMQKSYDILQDIGIDPYAVSYPYGSKEACSGMTADAARAAGFTYGFTMETAGVHSFDQPLLLPRFDCIYAPGGKKSVYTAESFFSHMPRATWFT